MTDAVPVPDPGRAICSAKGCRVDATWQLVWNNPKLHAPDREKRWAACDDHRESLAQFLRLRGFLRRIDAFAPGDRPDPT